MSTGIITEGDEGTIHGYLTGELDEEWVRTLKSELMVNKGVSEVHFDMEEVDSDDAMGILEFINFIRQLMSSGCRVTLTNAPHILAHDLYRIGLLHKKSLLVLIDPRVELPYG